LFRKVCCFWEKDRFFPLHSMFATVVKSNH
jgi:hypothetical protein